MTERWRKRLGDLDDVTPSEDVFHRAHDGPQIPDEQIPRPSTGSRVVTGIAAFVVFALAIGVFAIPALRMNRDPAGIPGVGLQPLWPARTDADLEALQAQVEAGDVVWASHPQGVVELFADQVMGWNDAHISEIGYGGVIYGDTAGFMGCDVIGGPTPGAPSTVSPCPISIPYVEECPDQPDAIDEACVPGTETVPVPMYASSGAPSPYRVFEVYPRELRYFAPMTVTLYQPLETGDGQIWAVKEVMSRGVSVSASAGEQLADGDVLWASTDYGDVPGTFGFRMGSGECELGAQELVRTRSVGPSPDPNGGETPMPSIVSSFGGEMTIDPSGRGDDCPATDAGYVWAATSFDGPVGDPLDGSSGVQLVGLTAVPVIVTSDEGVEDVPTEAQTTTPPTEGVTPPPTSVHPTPASALQTNDSGLGFTIDLPTSWLVQTTPGVEGIWAGEAPEGTPYIEIVVDVQADPLDDTTTPGMDIVDLPPADGDYVFRGDGRAFRLALHGSGPNGEPTSEEMALIQQVVSSIRFKPWREGDERNGWVMPIRPPQSEGWFDYRGATYLLFNEESSVGMQVFGPLPPCEDEELSVDTDRTVVVQTCGGTSTTYGPNDSGGLARYPVIVAHDGSRIVRLPG